VFAPPPAWFWLPWVVRKQGRHALCHRSPRRPASRSGSAPTRAHGGVVDYGRTTGRVSSAAAEVKQNSTLTKEALRYDFHHPGRWLDLVPDKFTHLMEWSTRSADDRRLEQNGPDRASPPRPHLHAQASRRAEKRLLGGAEQHLGVRALALPLLGPGRRGLCCWPPGAAVQRPTWPCSWSRSGSSSRHPDTRRAALHAQRHTARRSRTRLAPCRDIPPGSNVRVGPITACGLGPVRAG